MSQQRYVSEELTHFVGSGISEEEQLSVEAVEEKQYSVLVDKILKTGWLLTDPRVYSVEEAVEMLTSKSLVYGTQPTAPSEDLMYQQAVCFCDIPTEDLGIFGNTYAKVQPLWSVLP